MNLKLRTPSMLSDLLRPESFLGRDLFDFGSDPFIPKLGVTVPSVNIRETEKEYLFEMAAPGLDRKDFTIELENRILNISVEKEEKKDEKENDYYRKEYTFSSFARSFALPENIKEGGIDAKYDNGILHIHVPKAKETPAGITKRISVG
jgi:HSP20 family protein